MEESRKLIRPAEVAAMLNIKESTVRTWARNRVLPSHKIGSVIRFDAGDITAFINKNRVEAKDDA